MSTASPAHSTATRSSPAALGRHGDDLDVGGDPRERVVDQPAWRRSSRPAAPPPPTRRRSPGNGSPIVRLRPARRQRPGLAAVAVEQAATDERRVELAHTQRDLVVDALDLAGQAHVEPARAGASGPAARRLRRVAQGDRRRHGDFDGEAPPRRRRRRRRSDAGASRRPRHITSSKLKTPDARHADEIEVALVVGVQRMPGEHRRVTGRRPSRPTVRVWRRPRRAAR